MNALQCLERFKTFVRLVDRKEKQISQKCVRATINSWWINNHTHVLLFVYAQSYSIWYEWEVNYEDADGCFQPYFSWRPRFLSAQWAENWSMISNVGVMSWGGGEDNYQPVEEGGGGAAGLWFDLNTVLPIRDRRIRMSPLKSQLSLFSTIRQRKHVGLSFIHSVIHSFSQSFKWTLWQTAKG